uniref:Malectin-like domain-containing protein n=1 Tax=Leersia perrieri TaxID=77586 RepID=A0A0D9X7K5_9ORYZ
MLGLLSRVSKRMPTSALEGYTTTTTNCGLPDKTGYVDQNTGLSYVPDKGFTDTAENHDIGQEYIRPGLSSRYRNVRSFPKHRRGGARVLHV